MKKLPKNLEKKQRSLTTENVAGGMYGVATLGRDMSERMMEKMTRNYSKKKKDADGDFDKSPAVSVKIKMMGCGGRVK